MARPVTSQIYKDLTDSNEFRNAHKSAKDVVKHTLYALDKQGQLADSDYMVCTILISNFDLYYRLKDELLKGSLTYKDARNKEGNGIVINPIFAKLASLSTSCTSILNQLGANTSSRRRLNGKEMSQGEIAPIDNILNENTDDKGFSIYDY